MRAAAIFLAAMLLAACAAGGKRGGNAPAVYDLGPGGGAAAGGMAGLALEVRGAEWLDSTAIQYRLAYAEAGRRRDYALARWAAPPAALVQQRLLRRLAAQPAGWGGARCLLRVDLDEFSQVFSTPGASRGVVQARLAITDRAGNLLAERSLQVEENAASPDSGGGAAALAAAVERLAAGMLAWRGELAAAGRLAACGREAL